MDITVQCVEQLLNVCDNNTKIVIVDNGSNNGTDKKLIEHFSDKENVKIQLCKCKGKVSFFLS